MTESSWAQFGKQGDGDGEFNMPWGITIDKQGNIFIADWRNDRIQKFTADGKFLMKFGSSGSGEGEFNRPTDVAVDKDGIIYVADWLNDRLQVFDPDGDFVTLKTGDATVSKWGKDKLDANPEMWGERERAQGLEREKDFWAPTGVEVDDSNAVFVCEGPRNRIQVYRKQASTFMGASAVTPDGTRPFVKASGENRVKASYLASSVTNGGLLMCDQRSLSGGVNQSNLRREPVRRCKDHSDVATPVGNLTRVGRHIPAGMPLPCRASLNRSRWGRVMVGYPVPRLGLAIRPAVVDVAIAAEFSTFRSIPDSKLSGSEYLPCPSR